MDQSGCLIQAKALRAQQPLDVVHVTARNEGFSCENLDYVHILYTASIYNPCV